MSSLVRTIHAELRKAIFGSPMPANDVYMLVCESHDQTKYCVPLVHVSPQLKKHFDLGVVRAFDLHRLQQNGLAMWALPAGPQSLVTAVELKDGRVLVDVPAVLPRIRNQALAQAARVALPGLAGLAMGLYGTLLLLLPSAWILRKALLVPARPHPAFSHCRASKILGVKAQACTTNSAVDSTFTT